MKEKLKKVESTTISDEILMNLPENYLQALARANDSELHQALDLYIEGRVLKISEEMGKISMFPKEKNWGTLFELQDLQSKLTEIKRVTKLFGRANTILNNKKKKNKSDEKSL